jgi:hypothetical protein
VFNHTDGRVPIFAGSRCIEVADQARAECLAASRNAQVVRKRKTQAIVEIHLLESGDDSRLQSHNSNSLKLTYNWETDTNPPHVWAFKRVLPARETEQHPVGDR